MFSQVYSLAHNLDWILSETLLESATEIKNKSIYFIKACGGSWAPGLGPASNGGTI